jgi:hypothetical protein
VTVRYSFSQLEALWIDAGGSKATAPLAAAIAEAESGGNPLAAYPGTTVAPGQGSTTDATGLWQILGLPQGNFTAAELTIPIDNARMAVAKYQQAGNSFSPWQTYTEGTYSIPSPVPAPASSVPGADAQGGVGGPATPTAAGAGGTASTGGSAPTATQSLGVSSIVSGASGLLKDVATVLDYVFGVFGKGQGWRIIFTLVAAAAVYGSYRAFGAAGLAPE